MNNKVWFGVGIIIVVSLVLSACGSTQPQQVVTNAGVSAAEYIDLKFENELLEGDLEELGRKVGDLNNSINDYQDELTRVREVKDDWAAAMMYLSRYMPEDERPVLLCEGWPSFRIKVEGDRFTDNCYNFENLVSFIYELEGGYTPDFLKDAEWKSDTEFECVSRCDWEDVDERPE